MPDLCTALRASWTAPPNLALSDFPSGLKTAGATAYGGATHDLLSPPQSSQEGRRERNGAFFPARETPIKSETRTVIPCAGAWPQGRAPGLCDPAETSAAP